MSAPIPNFPPLPMVRWKHFQRDFFEAFLRANFDWLRGTTGMPIAKAASTAFYKDIILLPSLLEHLVNLPEGDRQHTFVLVRWPLDQMSFFKDVDYASVSKHLVMKNLIECFSKRSECCIIAIRRSTAIVGTFETNVIAYSLSPYANIDLPDFCYWTPISLSELEFPAYVFIGPLQAGAFVDANCNVRSESDYLPL